jgi:hypothetical protein
MHIIVKIIKVKDRGKKTLKIARERGWLHTRKLQEGEELTSNQKVWKTMRWCSQCIERNRMSVKDSMTMKNSQLTLYLIVKHWRFHILVRSLTRVSPPATFIHHYTMRFSQGN